MINYLWSWSVSVSRSQYFFGIEIGISIKIFWVHRYRYHDHEKPWSMTSVVVQWQPASVSSSFSLDYVTIKRLHCGSPICQKTEDKEKSKKNYSRSREYHKDRVEVLMQLLVLPNECIFIVQLRKIFLLKYYAVMCFLLYVWLKTEEKSKKTTAGQENITKTG
jgi:hypothetical protein